MNPDFGDQGPPRKKMEKGGGDEWLVTYSDVITLLMAFFVMMFSVSKVDPAQYEQIRSVIKQEVGKQPITEPFSTVYDQMEEVLEDISDKDKAKVQRIPNGVLLEFTSSVMFEPGSAKLKPEMKPLLKSFVSKIQALELKSYDVVIEGHTDPSPTGRKRYKSNWELSAMRAAATLHELVANGIDRANCQIRAFADTKPRKPNKDLAGEIIPENQVYNRRVVIMVQR